eukprot:5962047-Alexandrium_andersonii.AAC.1
MSMAPWCCAYECMLEHTESKHGNGHAAITQQRGSSSPPPAAMALLAARRREAHPRKHAHGLCG